MTETLIYQDNVAWCVLEHEAGMRYAVGFNCMPGCGKFGGKNLPQRLPALFATDQQYLSPLVVDQHGPDPLEDPVAVFPATALLPPEA
jgi:hypothetical protein